MSNLFTWFQYPHSIWMSTKYIWHWDKVSNWATENGYEFSIASKDLRERGLFGTRIIITRFSNEYDQLTATRSNGATLDKNLMQEHQCII